MGAQIPGLRGLSAAAIDAGTQKKKAVDLSLSIDDNMYVDGREITRERAERQRDRQVTDSGVALSVQVRHLPGRVRGPERPARPAVLAPLPQRLYRDLAQRSPALPVCAAATAARGRQAQRTLTAPVRRTGSAIGRYRMRRPRPSSRTLYERGVGVGPEDVFAYECL